MSVLTKHNYELGGWSAKFGKERRKQRHPCECIVASVKINQPIDGQKLHILNFLFCAVPKLVGLPEINYSGLRWLCKTEGLGDRYTLLPYIFVKAKDSILSVQEETK